MTSASQIMLDAQNRPEFAVPSLSEASAKKVSELLQEDHDTHHVFFNQEGFHNHIPHHLLTVYALGADPAVIERMYSLNANYQRPTIDVKKDLPQKLHDPAKFKECLGKEKYYSDYLAFFQEEIAQKGWQQVINEYLLARDERAEDLLVRTYSGFLHPLIQLGFGVEFEQPAIVAEGLAQAAVHDNWITPLYKKSEEAANKRRKNGTPSKSLIDVLQEMRATQSLTDSTQWKDPNKIRDGILKRDPDTFIELASQYYVKDASDLEARTAEMIHLTAYFTIAAQRPPKEPKIDFFYMHCLNSSIFFTRFLKADWLKDEDKIRLLEWKARGDLGLYVSRHSPELLLDEIANYKPAQPAANGEDPWPSILERGSKIEDDGHSSKLIRAIAHAKNVCIPFEDKYNFKIKGELWDNAGHIAVDAADDWIRGAGFEEAWKDVKSREAKL